VSEAVLDTALRKITKSLDKFVERGKLTAQQRVQTLRRISTCVELEEVRGCQLVIEAVPERMRLKRRIFRQLGKLCTAEAVLATNTSSIPIARLAQVTRRPERVVGMHFMNPPQLMELVEVVVGPQTSPKVVTQVEEICTRIGKVPIRVRDSPGFVLNRLLIPMINEAVHVLAAGIAEREDIDRIMKLGARHPMGPLELADLIGLDICLDILERMYRETRCSKFRPAPLLKRMVKNGRLGRKTGWGFYEY
jgi:3-hydroxybutyryl-CoA dehydrogenase